MKEGGRKERASRAGRVSPLQEVTSQLQREKQQGHQEQDRQGCPKGVTMKLTSEEDEEKRIKRMYMQETRNCRRERG